MTVHVGFVLFDGVTQLDLTGPLQVLSRLPDARMHLLAHNMDLVRTDCFRIQPSTTFAACGPLEVLCVPGGHGVTNALRDRELLAFLRTQGAHAGYVTSVCTGAFLLGAAGLLRGRRATTHWAYHHLLPMTGAIASQGRVVRDGNLLTGGGVTAGIDFAFVLMAEMAGPQVAEQCQLALEYDPQPPFPAGSVDQAAPHLLASARAQYRPRAEKLQAALATAMAETE